MIDKKLNLRIGIVLLLLSVLMLLYAVPQWVQSPQNINNIFISPRFWPYVIAGLGCVCGILLIVANFRGNGSPEESEVNGKIAGVIRMVIMFLIMAGIYLGVTTLGMVWTAMFSFIGVLVLLQSKNYIVGILAAILLPLVCYVFFKHVIGSDIPQGLILSLP